MSVTDARRQATQEKSMYKAKSGPAKQTERAEPKREVARESKMTPAKQKAYEAKDAKAAMPRKR